MKILYVAAKYDYGKPEQGFSFEHENFYDTLLHLGHEIEYFDFLTLLQEVGRERMKQLLIERVRLMQPDLMFCCLFTDQFDFATIRSITDAGVITFNWFTDDHWRFDDFSQYWAPAFTWVATTASSALPKYERIGYKHAIKTQWACNHFQYRRLDMPLIYDVSFMGMAHGIRPRIIDALRQVKISVHVRGSGWPHGRVEQREMISIFNQSRINLNLSNASRKPSLWRRLTKRRSAQLQQIKGRNFEIPGCGGFLLTNHLEELDAYYVAGREVAVYDDLGDLVDKIRYYLEHEDERRAIAEAGYQRTLRDHTYEIRFRIIFGQMGLR